MFSTTFAFLFLLQDSTALLATTKKFIQNTALLSCAVKRSLLQSPFVTRKRYKKKNYSTLFSFSAAQKAFKGEITNMKATQRGHMEYCDSMKLNYSVSGLIFHLQGTRLSDPCVYFYTLQNSNNTAIQFPRLGHQLQFWLGLSREALF